MLLQECHVFSESETECAVARLAYVLPCGRHVTAMVLLLFDSAKMLLDLLITQAISAMALLPSMVPCLCC
jgi:hypothetical protein